MQAIATHNLCLFKEIHDKTCNANVWTLKQCDDMIYHECNTCGAEMWQFTGVLTYNQANIQVCQDIISTKTDLIENQIFSFTADSEGNITEETLINKI